MNLGPQKISDTYQLVLNQSGSSVTLGNGNNPNWIGTTVASTTGAQTISGVKTFANNSIFSGNIGIGDPSPTEKLDVVGNGSIARFAGTTNEWQGIIVQTNASSSTVNKGAFIDFRNENDIVVNSLNSYHFSGGNSDFFINTTLSGSRSTDRRVERFRIKSNGDTIIGPGSGLTLEVKGGIRTEGGSPGAFGSNNNGYAFSSPGDSDAGMFSSADGQIEFYTNNSESMRISGANIGIANITPRTILHTSGEITSSLVGAANFRAVNGNYGTFFRNDGANFYLLFTASGDQFGSWNTLRPFYANIVNGNVTIGTNLTVSSSTTTNTLTLGSQSNKAAISYDTNTARTFTLPSVDGNRTFAFIDQTQTFSTAQTFSNNLTVRGNLDFGASTLGGTAASSFFKTNAGQLGTTAGNTLNLASIGFNSTNSNSLSFIARRQSNGSDWTTAAVGLSYNVDSTTGVGPGGIGGVQEIWMLPNGNVGLGTNAATQKLDINGNLKVQGNIDASGYNISNISRLLSADVNIGSNTTWRDVLSGTLSSGTWLVNSSLLYYRTLATADIVYCRLSGASTIYATTSQNRVAASNATTNLSLTSIITLSTPTNIVLQAIQSNNTTTTTEALVKAAMFSNGGGNNATQLTAIKIS